jgi:4-amino-4-deoxy-L-arabinose transferase-like glycosyltransferase
VKYPALLLATFAAVLTILASGLRPDAFFVGDPGVKLIAARNAIAHPSHPLNLPLPTINGQAIPFIEPFFAVHDDHAHAITSELFPLVSAPLIRWFGVRGAYLLPAAGFLGILVACAWLAVTLDARRSPAIVVLLAGLATPFLFYGLEFWEHAIAVAMAVLATTMFVRAVIGTEARVRRGLAFGSGAVFGIALLMRPEVACVLVAVLAASPLLGVRPRWSSVGLLLLGAVVALAPLEIYTLLHFGNLIPSHIGTNSGLIGAGWVSERLPLVREWLVPSGWTSGGPTRPASFWTVAPAMALAFVPLPSGTERRERRYLWAVAALTCALVLLTAPNDGGGQWGPRYLLFAYVPLVILAADFVEALPRRHAAALVLLAVILLGSVWVQRSAYRRLRGTKATYGRVVDFVANEVAPGGYVVTDLWWLDQIAAAATSERQLVYARDSADGHAAMKRLSDSTVPIVSVIRSASESPDLAAWADDTCYVEMHRHTLAVRDLVVILLHHRCSQ